MMRIKELDGLRAAAILFVIAWHYIGIGDGPAALPWHLFVFGRTGVDLFFVLSGYLITTILLTNKDAPNYFSTFYRRRSARILPIYFMMVAIYLIGRQFGGSAPILFGGTLPWWCYAVGLQNFWMAAEQTYGASWLAGTWSLAIEEQFYLIFPLVIYVSPARLIPKLLIALLLLCPMARTIAASLGDEFGYYVLMPMRADILAAGALIAWLQFNGGASAKLRQILALIFWSAVCFFPIFAWIVENSTFNNAAWGHSYLAMLYGSILFWVIDLKGTPRLAFLRSEIGGFFARISYALYLTHGCVLLLVFMAAGGNHSILTWRGMLLAVVSFAISIAICVASYVFIEQPIAKMAHGKFDYLPRVSFQP